MVAQAEPAPDVDPDDAAHPSEAELPQVANVLHPPPPPLFMEAAVRASHRLGAAGQNAPPAWGIGFSLVLGTRYAYVADRVELGLALDFGYAHHSQDVEGIRVLPSGERQTFEGQQLLSESTFGLMHTAAAVFERFRPWVGFGGGLAVSYFDSDAPRFQPGARRAYRPYAHGAAGVAVPLWGGPSYVNLRVDYHHMLASGIFTNFEGTRTEVMGSLVGFGAAFGSRF